MKIYRWLGLPAVLALGACVPPQALQRTAPVTQATPPAAAPSALASTETLQALAQMIDIKEDLKKIRNALEELEFNADNAKRRQQNLSQDLDRRLLALERAQRLLSPTGLPTQTPLAAPTATPSITPTDAPLAGAGASGIGGQSNTGRPVPRPVEPATTAADGAAPPSVTTVAEVRRAVSLQEEQAYNQAFNLLKQSRFAEAILQFQAFTDAWPDGQLAADAYYWVAEAQRVNREYQAALDGFKIVAQRYPESKRTPHAMLKMGSIKNDIGAYAEAAEIFREVLAKFPDHEVATPAKIRLNRIERNTQ